MSTRNSNFHLLPNLPTFQVNTLPDDKSKYNIPNITINTNIPEMHSTLISTKNSNFHMRLSFIYMSVHCRVAECFKVPPPIHLEVPLV